MEKTISYQAVHDSLTGLINRHEFERQVGHVLQAGIDRNEHHALCYLNIDQFKIVNDTCSHKAGDAMLVGMTAALKGCLRESDILARIGGDEFGVLLRNCSLKDAVALAETMLTAVREMEVTACSCALDASVSIGVVPVNRDSANVTGLMSSADLACYAAKEFGGNRLHVYEAGDQDLARRHTEMQWVSKLIAAIDADRLVLYCQKIAPVGREKDEGRHFEVLVRMLDAGGQLVMPGSFLPAAERYNIITSLDRWVVSHSFAWYAENRPFIENGCVETVSINISGASVTDGGFMEFIRKQLQEYTVDPAKICFEITETAAIANLDAALQFILGLKELGCRFMLDDFGSGLSSFAYLKNLPVDYLKIDGSFVRHMETDAVDCAMVSAIHQLGSLVGIRTIAEFVENEGILKKLEEIGVDYAQGYVISEPVPLDSLAPGKLKTA
jgi:diguanylate cyclase (GGDEF)-like protein